MREIKFRAWDKENKKFYTPIISANGKSLTVSFGYEIFGENNDDIMQYTGIKDKNGKPIFEGDIIKYKNSITSIQWTGCGFNGVYHNSDGSWDDEWEYALSYRDSGYIEVLGNLFENPNLIN